MESCPIDGINENGEEILGTFVTLEDANNFVRNRCADKAVRDDPDAIFSEKMSADRRISWCYEDEDGYGTALRIDKRKMEASGSVPARDWGRPPIGGPCPKQEDSEDENESSSSGMTNFAGLRNEIEFRSHR